MEKLILETVQRGVKSYHKLDSFPVIIGRAFTSDVIVSDITVSASHLKIDRSEAGFEVQNLSDENGSRLNNERLSGHPVPLEVPAQINLGDFKGRLLAPDTTLAPTRIKSAKSGWFSFLSSPYWSVFFVLLTAVVMAVDKYISTPVAQDVLVYISKVLPAMLMLFGLALLISSVSRLSAHRWAFIPALNIASLFLLLPLLFGYIGHFLDYFFTTGWSSTVMKHTTSLLLLPALLVLYLARVHYLKFITAVGISVLVTMPVTAFFVADFVDQISNRSSFTPVPKYNKTLSSLDFRMKKTMKVDDFLDQSQTVLDQKVNKLLEKAKE